MPKNKRTPRATPKPSEAPEYARALGLAVLRGRDELDLTQEQLASYAETTSRTIIDIEQNRGNPKLETLYRLIRVLHIDPRQIFNPEDAPDTPAISQLKQIAATCSEEEAAALLKVCNSVLSLLHSSKTQDVK